MSELEPGIDTTPWQLRGSEDIERAEAELDQKAIADAPLLNIAWKVGGVRDVFMEQADLMFRQGEEARGDTFVWCADYLAQALRRTDAPPAEPSAQWTALHTDLAKARKAVLLTDAVQP